MLLGWFFCLSWSSSSSFRSPDKQTRTSYEFGCTLQVIQTAEEFLFSIGWSWPKKLSLVSQIPIVLVWNVQIFWRVYFFIFVFILFLQKSYSYLKRPNNEQSDFYKVDCFGLYETGFGPSRLCRAWWVPPKNVNYLGKMYHFCCLNIESIQSSPWKCHWYRLRKKGGQGRYLMGRQTGL